MYSVSQQSKLASSVIKPINTKNFLASSISGSNSTIHFSYRLVDLQKEIEKRTFYLGKYRKTEEASHLLDLIGMSRDEGDLLYPFAKSAMADVYDRLNISTVHIPKGYKWMDAKIPTLVNAIPALAPLSANDVTFNSNISSDKKSISISGTIQDNGLASGTAFSNTTFKIVIQATISYSTEYSIIGTQTTIRPTYVLDIDIPVKNIRPLSANQWYIAPFTFTPKLELQSDVTSVEILNTVTNITFKLGSERLEYVEPVKLNAGDTITYNNVNYEVLVDTDTNNLDVSNTTQVIQVDASETLVEGIHYYFAVPNYMNITSVEPLDNAIMEALVNRIIWKWLVLSYPNEAATYDTLYKDNLNSIATRCNIFNKNWSQVPRIL